MTETRLGAWCDARGAWFQVYSQHARTLWLCLLDELEGVGLVETQRLPMQPQSGFLWRLWVPECQPGQRYGYRADGVFCPDEGHYFNPSHLLLDPYAIHVEGDFHWHASTLNHPPDHPGFHADSLAHVPYARVPAALPPLQHPRIHTPWEDTVIYEVHVKGMTCLNAALPEAQRGRYLGLSHPIMIDYFRRLGVTTLQLLPVHFCVDELHLRHPQRVNYWGYNPLAWFAPTPRYAALDAVQEFRAMVEQLHAAGIEVVLDVVFNHTAEGDQRGPALGLRGLDNATYYRRTADPLFVFSNESGCGNCLDTDQPICVQLITDCLRFWAVEMGVDGFRFDLASALSRHHGDFDATHPLWMAILQDPVLRSLKWIVEPWDVGAGGYQLGRFPEGFSEWNDQFRNDLRCFVRGDHGQLGNFARRMAGSWDIFRKSGTGVRGSINYITAHDGFTLRDLVSYLHKHNAANGEQNQDGAHDNFSANYGVEGDTDDPFIQQTRARQQRNFIALLGWAQGVPMLAHGDEGGRTQLGNNNAYCQDNALSWCHWPVPQADLLAFTQQVFALRKQLKMGHVYKLRQPLWQQINSRFIFYRPDGQRMAYDDWMQSYARSIAIEMTTPVTRVLLLVNMHDEALRYHLPDSSAPQQWALQLDTAITAGEPPHSRGVTCATKPLCYLLHGRSVALLTEIQSVNALFGRPLC